MPRADPSEPLVPGFAVLVDGRRLEEELRSYVVELLVDTDLRLPGMFELTLAGADPLETEVPWLHDRDLFDVGMEVEVRMGYSQEVAALLVGEIVSLEPDFAHDRLPRLTVRGYDRGHRLRRTPKTRSFLAQTDSQIASTIAREAGLTPRVEATDVTHEYVLQANQTDMEFLEERARAVRYEVLVERRELHFRPAPEGESETLTLAMGEELLEFRPRVTSTGQPTATRVRGWDPKRKEAIVGRAEESGLPGAMDGASRGPALARGAVGEAPWRLTDRPVLTQGEADTLAAAHLGSAAGNLISGEGACWGRTDLKAGVLVRIEGVGERYAGRYYVTAATHRYVPQEGYVTRFRMRRNAL